MYLMTILKDTNSQGFTLSLEDTFLEKPQGGEGGGGGQIDPPLVVLGLKHVFSLTRFLSSSW